MPERGPRDFSYRPDAFEQMQGIATATRLHLENRFPYHGAPVYTPEQLDQYELGRDTWDPVNLTYARWFFLDEAIRTTALDVVNFGIGDGRCWSRFPKQHRLTVIEPAAEAVKKGMQEGAIQVNAELITRTQPPYEIDDGSVDLIVTNGVLHQFPDEVMDSLLSEMYRILRPNGRIFISWDMQPSSIFLIQLPEKKQTSMNNYLAKNRPESLLTLPDLFTSGLATHFSRMLDDVSTFMPQEMRNATAFKQLKKIILNDFSNSAARLDLLLNLVTPYSQEIDRDLPRDITEFYSQRKGPQTPNQLIENILTMSQMLQVACGAITYPQKQVRDQIHTSIEKMQLYPTLQLLHTAFVGAVSDALEAYLVVQLERAGFSATTQQPGIYLEASKDHTTQPVCAALVNGQSHYFPAPQLSTLCSIRVIEAVKN